MTDTFNEAWEEAQASCPPSVRQYDTLEIYHPSFEGIPARVVANVADDMEFTLEPDAEFDGSASVSFQACPLSFGWPEVKQAQPPQAKVSIDNVNRELVPKIRAALGIRAYISVIYRQYLSSDLTEPAYGPVKFLLKDVQMQSTKLTGNVIVAMLSNRRIPKQNKNYDYNQFPSLIP